MITVNGSGRRDCSSATTPPANRMSLKRTVVVPPESSDRAAGKREKPRNTCAVSVPAARVTASVHKFGYRTARRQKTSDSDAGERKRASSTLTSCNSYAFENRAMTRHENGDTNDGIAAISTRQRRAGGAAAASTASRRCGHASTTALPIGASGHGGGSVGPNRRGASASA